MQSLMYQSGSLMQLRIIDGFYPIQINETPCQHRVKQRFRISYEWLHYLFLLLCRSAVLRTVGDTPVLYMLHLAAFAKKGAQNTHWAFTGGLINCHAPCAWLIIYIYQLNCKIMHGYIMKKYKWQKASNPRD